MVPTRMILAGCDKCLGALGEDERSYSSQIGKSGKVKEDSVGGTGIDYDVFGTGVGLAINRGTDDGFGDFGDGVGGGCF